MTAPTVRPQGAKPPRIVPSILSADFARLADQVAEAAEAGVDTVQVDVMDGRFVPNITVGLPVVEALRAVTPLRLDVHLMIEQPGIWIDQFASAGADVITVHAEASRHLHRDVMRIKEKGREAGVAINPATTIHALDEILAELDLALVMTVNPGFGGQKFIPHCLSKVSRLRTQLDASGSAARIQVDGGIDTQTAGAAVSAGAEELVAGSAVFSAGRSIAEAIAALEAAARL